jgi:hypothetical protein
MQLYINCPAFWQHVKQLWEMRVAVSLVASSWDIERPATLVSRDRVSRGGAIPLEEGDLRLLTLSPLLSRPVQSPVGW